MKRAPPHATGLFFREAAEALKAAPETAHISVIAVTVHVQEFYRGRAAVVGCDGFLPKPCSPTRLLGEITRLLHEEPQP